MRIEFEDDDRTLDVQPYPGETISQVLQRHGIGLASPCGGAGKCKKCKVTVLVGGERKEILACTNEAESIEKVTVPKSNLDSIAVEDGFVSAGFDPIDQRFDLDEGVHGYGVAIDIGTTTIAARLLRLNDGETIASAGQANPQASFGADVISRITACKEGNLATLSTVVLDCVEHLIRTMIEDANIDASEIERIAIAGNTVMECIAAKKDPTPIGAAPFTPPSLFGTYEPIGSDLPDVYFAPCVAGYVGGDIVCGALAMNLANVDAPVLFVDLGTNGEMILADESKMTSCATAAGPVFEGAGIKCGMPASVGAIDQVAYDDGTLRVHVIGDGNAVGICGSGLISGIAALLDAGVIDETGLLLDADEVPLQLADRIVELDDGLSFALTDDVSITQRDIRNVQLAKGSVCAGIETLMEDAGLTPKDITALYVAGGLGTGLDMHAAARIGLFPQELERCAHASGNTSLKGACMLVLSNTERNRAQAIARDCGYIELSCDPGFSEHYIDDMIF